MQQLGSGTPIRLTKDAADERQPTFSPDGTRIAFYTERNGGGIEVMPALGGESRRIADGGQRPRFSPDGNSIAYWSGGRRRDPFAPAADKVFVVPATGGEPRKIPEKFHNARYPVWSPDGKYLLFAGWPDTSALPEQIYDWWVAPVDGGAPVKTGAAASLRAAGLPAFAIPGSWAGNQVVFSARLGDSTSLWQLEITPGTWRLAAAPTRLTTTTGLDAEPFFAADGSLVYAGLTENADVWSLPLDADRGVVTGALHPLTRSAAADTNPTVSLDGKKLAFLSNRTGNSDVWLKDLVSGAETALTVTPVEERNPQISRDGSKVAYAVDAGIFVVSLGADGRPGVPAKVCEGCGTPSDWTPDGKALLLQIPSQPTARIGWLDLPSEGTRKSFAPSRPSPAFHPTCDGSVSPVCSPARETKFTWPRFKGWLSARSGSGPPSRKAADPTFAPDGHPTATGCTFTPVAMAPIASGCGNWIRPRKGPWEKSRQYTISTTPGS